MNAADRVIRWSMALAVVGVAAVAAVVTYEDASALVRARGESGWTGRLIPLTVDGLIYASSTVMLDSARRGARVPGYPRWRGGCSAWALLRRWARTSPTTWATRKSSARVGGWAGGWRGHPVCGAGWLVRAGLRVGLDGGGLPVTPAD
jgi:Protein of unknown function (DUF2637)